jgi:large subunit ribosomal protein L4
VHVVSDLVGGDLPATKSVLTALSAVTTSDKVLVVLGRDEDVARLSLRNVATVHALAVDQLNAYDVLVNDEIVFTTVALSAFIARPVAGKAVKAVASQSEGDAVPEPAGPSPRSDRVGGVTITDPDELVEPTGTELAAEADGAETEEEETK